IIIRLNNNQITGTFPEDCDALPNLEYLDLSSNQLADSIPSDLGYLVNLDTLYLDNNQLFGSIPSSLGQLTNLRHLWLNNNQLTDSIPKALGQLTNLTSLWLHKNQLSGSIPDTLKNLTSLESLYLSSNQLTDSIPSSLTNLAGLQDELSDFRWNGLYTENSTLASFLDDKQWGNDWESTQTIAPQNMTSSSATDTSITLTWTPITFTDYTGGYRIYRSTIPGGPYTECGMTANKTVNSLKINGLAPDITYYFVIRTQTDPHVNNNNTVISNPSAEISASTTPPLNPEMDVQGNNTSIADNDGTPDPADGTDFGNIAVDDDNKSQTFTIENTGMIDLNLTGDPKVQITGTHASDFTVVSQPSSPVAAEGGTTTFIIQFDPSAFGIRNATVTIDNNDSDEDPYNFNIRGTGEWPDMDVLGNGNVISDNDFVPEPEGSLNADSTDFGNVAVVGETVSHTFTIENNGNANLVLTGNPKVTVNSTVFTISSQPSSPIAPGESTTFTIKFNPDITTIGDTIVTVSIDNNSSENPYDFAIQGT
ncbi:MAG: choice-of-anchor D domain-containing protein, partial [bacterium]